MNTFMPLPSMLYSLHYLDDKRLGKQRVEAREIIDILCYGKESRWRNHPAVKMWVGYEEYLKDYYNIALMQWEDRGFRNIILKPENADGYNLIRPHWLGNMEFHISHQSNLVRKKPEHYRKFFPTVADNLPYIWPKGKEL